MNIDGIILAAGLSSRMNEYKMEMKIGNLTILDKAILSMGIHVKKIYVVTGHNKEIIEQICSKYDYVKTVHNYNYVDGMFSSIKLAVSCVNSSRFFLMPGDYPFVKMSTFRDLINNDGDVVIPSFNFKSGHPILLNKKLANKIIASNAISLKEFLSSYKKNYVTVHDDAILIDIDTDDDFEKALRRQDDENYRSSN